MNKKVLYVARDKDGALCAYTNEPVRHPNLEVWMAVSDGDFEVINEMESFFPELSDIRWEDEKAKKITISLEE